MRIYMTASNNKGVLRVKSRDKCVAGIDEYFFV
jgi:hypothetical protein